MIDSLKKSDDSIINSDEEKAKIFNEFFISVFTHEDTSLIPTFHLSIPSIVYNKLKNLKHNKSPGSKGWPVLAAQELAKYTTFNKSLQSFSVPVIWKQTFITTFTRKVQVIILRPVNYDVYNRENPDP